MKQNKQQSGTQKKEFLFDWKIITIAVSMALFLFIANSALWVNNSVFDRHSFTSITTQALSSDSSRESIASEITDNAFRGRPLLRRALYQPAMKMIAGILDSNLAQTATERTTLKLHRMVTAKDTENVELDFAGIHSVVERLIVALDSAGVEPNNPISNFPERIIIIESTSVPKVYNLGKYILWIGPLAFLICLLLLLLPHIKRQKLNEGIIAIQGAALVVIWGISRLIGPLLRPLVVADASSAHMGIVVGNIYNGFVASFNSQQNWIGILGLIMIVSTSAYKVYGSRKATK